MLMNWVFVDSLEVENVGSCTTQHQLHHWSEAYEIIPVIKRNKEINGQGILQGYEEEDLAIIEGLFYGVEESL